MSLAESGEAVNDRNPFDYSAVRAASPIRGDLVEAHRRVWRQLAAPGTWWSGAERVALAAEVRAAEQCGFCAERRVALSPFSVTGEHDQGSGGVLPDAAVDAVHRLVTDPSRLSRSWVEGLAQKGVPDTHYVELLSHARCHQARHTLQCLHQAAEVRCPGLYRGRAQHGPRERQSRRGLQRDGLVRCHAAVRLQRTAH